MENENARPEEIRGIDAGTVLLHWETWEFPPVERSTRWYVIAGVVGFGMLIYAILTANFVFALIVLMFAAIMLLKDLKKPKRVQIAITSSGVVFDNEFHSYDDIKDFSMVYQPPEVSMLYVAFRHKLSPLLAISLEEMNPNEVREALLPFVFENLDREGERLTDVLTRVYKL